MQSKQWQNAEFFIYFLGHFILQSAWKLQTWITFKKLSVTPHAFVIIFFMVIQVTIGGRIQKLTNPINNWCFWYGIFSSKSVSDYSHCHGYSCSHKQQLKQVFDLLLLERVELYLPPAGNLVHTEASVDLCFSTHLRGISSIYRYYQFYYNNY